MCGVLGMSKEISGHWEYRVVDHSDHSVHEKCYEICRVFIDTDNQMVAHFPVRMITNDLGMMKAKIGALEQAMTKPLLKASKPKESRDE